MPPKTLSFEMRSNRPDQAVDALALRARSSDFRSAIVFLSGALASSVAEVAQGLAAAARPTRFLLLPAVGVLTERGEVEHQSAVAALFHRGDIPLFTHGRASPEFGQKIIEGLQAQSGACAFIAVRADNSDDGWLEHLDHHFKRASPQVFGGGLIPRSNAYHVDDGLVSHGDAACAILPANTIGHFRASSACRLISPLTMVTKARGPVLHEMEGMRALDRLSEATHDLVDQPLVMLAVASGKDPLSRQGRSIALRAIVGVDPGRGALIFAEHIPEEAKVAFAVRDARAARHDLEVQMRGLKSECGGSAPDFGIFVSCAGRGSGLYEQPDVDLRIVRKSFPRIPLVGMHSTFELAPVEGRTVPQIYTAVVGVFCRPN